MKTSIAAAAALFLVATFAGCVDEEEAPRVRFETTVGDFTIELWPDKAPVTVENFLRYVQDGHYDGLTFHRVAPNFVVQGGGYLPDHSTLRPTRGPIVNEASTEVRNEKWTLSMARLEAPDTATSQFFINLKDNQNLDKQAGSAGYAVFGKVVSGFSAIENMTQVEPGRSFGQAGGFYPAEPIVIEDATQISGAAPKPLAPADVHADLITPGTWRVTNTSEAILVWADNLGQTPATVNWSMRGDGGAALPEGWTVSFARPSQEIGADGTTSQSVHTLVTLTVPADASGQHQMELRTGHRTTSFVVDIDLDGDRISRAGDAVRAQYRGWCTENDEEFDSGAFDVTLGSPGAIAGFSYGLIGLQQNEEATIVMPAQLGYGDNGGPCASLDDAGMAFEVQILAFN